MKWLIVGSMVILSVTALIVSRKSRPARIASGLTNHPAALLAPEAPAIPLENIPNTMSVPKPEDRLLSLPEFDQFTPAAQHLLRGTLHTCQSLELEKRKFQPHSPGEVLLGGLQRKLFLDDYTYAALRSGRDCSAADRAFTNLLRHMAALDEAALKEGASGL